MTERREGHGFWAYLVPMVSFLILLEIEARAPEAAAPGFLFIKVLVPLGLFLWFLTRGAYPELRGYRPTAGALLQDVGVGLAGAMLWIAPFVLSSSARAWATEDPESAFDPEILGASLAWLAISIRAVGYAFVTPFVEELFVRSWLLRYVDVVDKRLDFRDVPIARYTLRSFLVVVIYFTLSHVPWEYPVMLAWTLGTMAWFYHRKHLMPIIVVHAVTNGAILLFAAAMNGRILDAAGQPINLWFFV